MYKARNLHVLTSILVHADFNQCGKVHGDNIRFITSTPSTSIRLLSVIRSTDDKRIILRELFDRVVDVIFQAPAIVDHRSDKFLKRFFVIVCHWRREDCADAYERIAAESLLTKRSE